MLRVAIVFTIGCSVLVCNAVLSILPIIPRLEVRLPEGCIYVEGILSVLSCTLFLVGSAFAFLEAWTLDDGAEPGLCSQIQGVTSDQTMEIEFGKKATEQENNTTGSKPEHRNDSAVDLLKHDNRSLTDLEAEKPDEQDRHDTHCSKTSGEKNTTNSSRARYLELGIFASTIFLCSSALYCATSIASLVTIVQSEEIARCIRYPQLVAASGFATASFLLIIKTQRDSRDYWWRLPLFSLGFHINFWNLIGSTGFLFCAYFGLLEHAFWAQQQFGWSYLWGSWAFLIGSLMSWWKSSHRKEYSVDVWKVEKPPV